MTIPAEQRRDLGFRKITLAFACSQERSFLKKYFKFIQLLNPHKAVGYTAWARGPNSSLICLHRHSCILKASLSLASHQKKKKKKRKNKVFLDACVPLQRIFSFKIKLKPAELSEHLGQIKADMWFPVQNLLVFIIAVALLQASPQPLEASWAASLAQAGSFGGEHMFRAHAHIQLMRAF